MNVASTELSNELYELSGWCPSERCNGIHYETSPPSYELGYLLRSIGEKYRVSVDYCKLDQKLAMDLKSWEGKWICYTPYMEQGIYPYADTPEDAAAMLAIELFKQGILTKESRA